MLIAIVIAMLVAFTSSKVLGKKLIPRLEKKREFCAGFY